MPEIATYLINLDDSQDRLAAADKTLLNAGVTYERLPAVDARGRALSDFPAYDAKSALWRYGTRLRGGEIGCYLSHLRAAEQFLASDATACVVLEDDIALSDGFGALVRRTLDALETHAADQWELVNLGKATKPKYACKVAEVGPGHWLEFSGVFSLTTHALLWSRKGAKAFIDAMGDKINMPVDHGLAYHMTLRGACFALNTPIAQQADFDSVIDNISDRSTRETLPMRLAKFRRKWITGYVARRNMAAFRKTIA